MGFELLPIEPDDEDRYDIITITSPEKWDPHKFTKVNNAVNNTYYYDPADLSPKHHTIKGEDNNYPASFNHLSALNDCFNDYDRTTDCLNDPECPNDQPYDYDCPNDHL